MKIRLMKKEDVSKIVKIYSKIDLEDSKIIKKVYTKYYSGKKSNNVKDYVLEVDKKIVAFSGFNKEITDSKDIYWLNWTGVEKSQQKNGYGKTLISHIKKNLKKAKGRKLYISTSSDNKNAITFYKKVGFKQEGRLKDYYSNGKDSIMFGLKL